MKGILNGEWRVLMGGGMPELSANADGVFETLLLRHGSPVFWQQHWARFLDGCRYFDLKYPSEQQITKAIDELVAANAVCDGIARFAVWKESPDRVVDGRPTLVWRVDVSPPRAHMGKPHFVLEWGPVIQSVLTPTHALKHLRRLSWLDTLRATRGRGYDEALLHDSAGNLIEGCISNLFFVRDDVLYTPSLVLGPLPGVMRANVLACAPAFEIEIREGGFSKVDLEKASEVWLTNSLIGIRPVAALGDKPFPRHRPVLEKIRAGWQRLHGWDPVVLTGG